MPQFPITLSEKALARLQAEVDRSNANNGTNLTARDWIVLHLKEIAIAEELAAAIDQLRKQAERDAQTTLEATAKAERERLLQNL